MNANLPAFGAFVRLDKRAVVGEGMPPNGVGSASIGCENHADRPAFSLWITGSLSCLRGPE